MKFKSIGAPVLTFLIYICLAVLFHQFIADAVLVTILADISIGAAGWFYYRNHIGDSRLAYSRSAFWIMAGAGFVVWFISSLTVTWLQQQSWCVSFGGDLTELEVNPWLYILLTLVIAPVSEEIMFRGILLRSARQLMPMSGAYVVTALIFGLFHGNASQFYVGFTCGILFSLIYEYTGRLHISMAAHMIYNFVVLGLAGRFGLADVWFSPAVLVSLNVLLFVGFLAVGIWLDQSVRKRTGIQSETCMRQGTGKRLVNLDVYSTVAGLSRLMMPGVNLLIMGPDQSQLYLGPASDVGTIPGLSSRQVSAGSMFTYCSSGDPDCIILAFSVL